MGVPITFAGTTGPSKSDEISVLFFKQLHQIGTGEGTGNHANLIKYGIHALTMRMGGPMNKGIISVISLVLLIVL